jgi:hypothetical protein
MSDWKAPARAQITAASKTVEAIVRLLKNDRGVHAETAIAAAARLAGTFLFRSFKLPTAGIEPGSPVLSEQANEQGPALVQTFAYGLAAEGIDPQALQSASLDIPEQNQPLLTVVQTQEKLEAEVRAIVAGQGLADPEAAHACALAAARLVKMTVQVLDPRTAFAVAAYGFVEGSKTMPVPVADAPPAKKPWYRFW